jgi:hypothetical protein
LESDPALRSLLSAVADLTAAAGEVTPERRREALATIRRLALGSDEQAPSSRGGADGEPRPARWTTIAGSLAGYELEERCRAHGVALDRGRRAYWQSERVFPQPARRRLRPPEARGGARGYYHPGAVDLARVIDYAVRADHPDKRERWRCTVRELAAVVTGWRADAGGDEEAFHARVAAMVPLIGTGDPLPGALPPHRDVIPPGQHRLPHEAREEALAATARVAEAIADDWVARHAGDDVPDRLVVWLRMERSGLDDWRIAGAGAGPTSRQRRRGRPPED